MCLDRVIQMEKLTKNYGWKVMNKYSNDTLHSLFVKTWYSLKQGVWLKSTHPDKFIVISIVENIKYKNGFHSFLYKKDAIAYIKHLHFTGPVLVVKKVYFKNIVAIGTQCTQNYKVIVSKQIKIEKKKLKKGEK